MKQVDLGIGGRTICTTSRRGCHANACINERLMCTPLAYAAGYSCAQTGQETPGDPSYGLRVTLGAVNPLAERECRREKRDNGYAGNESADGEADCCVNQDERQDALFDRDLHRLWL